MKREGGSYSATEKSGRQMSIWKRDWLSLTGWGRIVDCNVVELIASDIVEGAVRGLEAGGACHDGRRDERW